MCSQLCEPYQCVSICFVKSALSHFDSFPVHLPKLFGIPNQLSAMPQCWRTTVPGFQFSMLRQWLSAFLHQRLTRWAKVIQGSSTCDTKYNTDSTKVGKFCKKNNQNIRQ